MNIIFSSITFKNYAGSEIVTLDEANWFAKRGDSVTIFTLEAGAPLTEHLDKRVKIIEQVDTDELSDNYDLAIFRQWPLAEYLLFSKRIKPKKVYLESISWSLPIDFPPYFYKELSLIGCVSERVKAKLGSIGYDTSRMPVFPNYALPEFGNTEFIPNESPKQIAVVSNHPPAEIVDLVKEGTEKGICIDLFGMNGRYELITAEILSNYDVVVSMGKTIFCSLSMGMPSYQYDTTCTTGYVTLENYESCLRANMASSSGADNRKTGKQILHDIVSGYEAALHEGRQLRLKATNDFDFNRSMNQLLQTIEECPAMDYASLYQKYPLAQNLSAVFAPELGFAKKEIMRWYDKSLELGNLLRAEWDKTSSLSNQVSLLETQLGNANEKIRLMENSKGWKMVEFIKTPLKAIRNIKHKKIR